MLLCHFKKGRRTQKSNEKQVEHIVRLFSVHRNPTSSMEQHPIPTDGDLSILRQCFWCDYLLMAVVSLP